VRVLTFLASLTFICHVMACGWYLVAALHQHPNVTWVAKVEVTRADDTAVSLLEQGPIEQWLFAMYFIITVFTTVGFGDISPNTEAEIVYVFLVMLVGAVVHSIVISEVIQVVTSTDLRHEYLENQLELLGAFSLHTNLDPQLSDSIQAEFRERHQHGMEGGFNKDEMTALLLSKHMPRPIIDKLPDGLHRGQLCKNLFLKQFGFMPPRLPSLLAIHLLTGEFMSGEVIYQLHDFAFNLGLVISGICANVAQPGPRGGKDALPAAQADSREEAWHHKKSISIDTHGTNLREEDLSASHLSPYRLVGRNNYFGDLECITGSMREATMRCERTATILLLGKRDLFDTISEFPQCGEVWTRDSWRREALRKKALKRLRYPQSCRTLAAITIQKVFRERDTSNHVSRPTSNQPTIWTHWQSQMVSPAQSQQSCLVREVDKVHRGVLGMQSEISHMHEEMSEMRSDMKCIKVALQGFVSQGKASL